MQYDFGTINPSKTSGGALAGMLNNSRDAAQSSHSGSTRPTYAKAGMPWLDTSVTPWKYYMFDGADDILIGTFNITTNVFSPVVASSNISDATTIGKAVLTASSTANAQTAIGGSTVGKAVLTASSTANAQTAIGGSTVGKALFVAANDGAARTAISAAKSGVNTDITRLDGCGPETNSVCIGSLALSSRTTGINNLALGANSLRYLTSGVDNNAIGRDSGGYFTSGSYNTALGDGALLGVGLTTHNGNTAAGYNAGNSSVGEYNTFIGYNAGVNTPNYSNVTCLGRGALVSGSNQVQLGNSSTTTYVYGTVQNRSDARDKAEVKNTSLGLSFINSLRPVDYKLDMREDYRKEGQKFSEVVKDGSKVRGRYHHGFIAQEVGRVIKESGIDFGGYQDHKIAGGEDVLSLGYDEFIAPLVKAVQELSAKVNSLEARLAKVKG